VRLLNLGLATAFVTVLFQSRLKPVGAAMVVAGLVLYGMEMRAILQARKRRTLDWALRQFLAALALLPLVAVIGVVLSWPSLPLTGFTGQLENVYGFLALIGVVTLAVLGMLYKVVPFLVWYASYSREIGRRKVPSLAELYSVRLQVASFGLLLAGILGTALATALAHEAAVRWGTGVLAAGLILFGWNLGLILRHLIRPVTAPLVRHL
jgi:hypothetical protein